MGQNWVKCEMSVNGRWMVLTRTDLAGSLLRRISQSSFIWNSLSGRWLLLWPALCSNDRSSEAVWCGDDLSSDRHFLPLIDHRKKVPVRRAIIWKNYFTWAIIGRKCRSEERSSPHQTVSDDWSSGGRVRLSKNNHCHELWTILSLCRQLHITAGVSCWVHRQLEALYCQGQGKACPSIIYKPLQ